MSKLSRTKSARNLGVIFHKYFTFCSHIPAVRSSWLYHFRHLQRIRHYLGFDSARLLSLLAIALLSSHLSFCNSLWSDTADTDLTRLQHVQNRLTHIVTKFPPFACSVSLLRSLHLLPVQYRIVFKISLLTYRTLREKQECLPSLLACNINPIKCTGRCL